MASVKIINGNTQTIGIEIESYNQNTPKPTASNPYGGMTDAQRVTAAYLSGELVALMEARTPVAQLIAKAAENTAGALSIAYKFDEGSRDPKNFVDGEFNPIAVMLHETFGIDSLIWMRDGASKAQGFRTSKGGYPRACHFLIHRDGTFTVMTVGKCYHAGQGTPFTTLPSRVCNHKDWAPGRKPDTQFSSENWAALIKQVRVTMALSKEEKEEIAELTKKAILNEKMSVLDPTDKTHKGKKTITVRNSLRLQSDRLTKLLWRL